MKRKLAYLLLVGFILVNIVAYNHAYQFSHFNIDDKAKTVKPEELSFAKKLRVLFTGISNPKPVNEPIEIEPTEKLRINTHSNYTLDAWVLKVPSAKGTVLLFHGYTAKKSDLIEEAIAFNTLGYDAVMVDFYGSGDSDGSETTVGYLESEDVANTFRYFKAQGEQNIILFGASMGAVAITKAVADHQIEPTAIILECPYGKLLTTVKNRFDIMGVPSLGFAELLVFWGGAQNGYWGFSMNTIEFANRIQTPTLVMAGKDDKRANFEEVEAIYTNLKGEKKLRLFEGAGHEPYLDRFPEDWKNEVGTFLDGSD